MRRNVHSSAVLRGWSTFFHSNFTWRGPSTILGVRKLETLGYTMVKTASLCVPSFWHDTAVWRTDGRTDRQTDADSLLCSSVVINYRAEVADVLWPWQRAPVYSWADYWWRLLWIVSQHPSTLTAPYRSDPPSPFPFTVRLTSSIRHNINIVHGVQKTRSFAAANSKACHHVRCIVEMEMEPNNESTGSVRVRLKFRQFGVCNFGFGLVTTVA